MHRFDPRNDSDRSGDEGSTRDIEHRTARLAPTVNAKPSTARESGCRPIAR
jgi:hypothetical protein